MMLEIKCPSCNTRYRIDEALVPKENPVFKCSRCGHVFSGSPDQTRDKTLSQPRQDPVSQSVTPQDGQTTGATASQHKLSPLQKKSRPPQQESSKPAGIETGSELKGVTSESFPDPQMAGGEAKSGDLSGELSDEEDEWVVGGDENLSPRTRSPEKRSSSETRPEKRAPKLSREWTIGEVDENLEGDTSFSKTDPGRFGRCQSFAAKEESRASAEGNSEKVRKIFSLSKLGNTFELGQSSSLKVSPRREARVGGPMGGFMRTPTEAYGYGETTANQWGQDMIIDSAPHSSGFFLGVFFALIVLFGGISVLISNEPALGKQLLTWMPFFDSELAEPPLASRVELRELQSKYERLKDNTVALLVTGTVLNRASVPLHTIQIVATLLDQAKRRVANQSVYCGNTIQLETVPQMTSREIRFFQNLPPPTSFKLDPGQFATFVVAFLKPPIESAHDFIVEIKKAEPLQTTADNLQVEGR